MKAAASRTSSSSFADRGCIYGLAAESVLREGETLTSLIETAMRETIHRRRVQDEFLARGLRSSEDAKRTGIYHSAIEVHGELQRRLDARRNQVLE